MYQKYRLLALYKWYVWGVMTFNSQLCKDSFIEEANTLGEYMDITNLKIHKGLCTWNVENWDISFSYIIKREEMKSKLRKLLTTLFCMI